MLTSSISTSKIIGSLELLLGVVIFSQQNGMQNVISGMSVLFSYEFKGAHCISTVSVCSV